MEWSIDRVIEHSSHKSADFLNACHACREGHPLNGADGNPFANVAFMAQGRLRSDGINWLRKQAILWKKD